MTSSSTKETASGGGFGPEPKQKSTETSLPYRAPMFPLSSAPRAHTLPELDTRSAVSGGMSGKCSIQNTSPWIAPPPLIMPSAAIALMQPHLTATHGLPLETLTPYRYPGMQLPYVTSNAARRFGDDTDLVRPAPGPDRRRGRRSEGGALISRRLFSEARSEHQRLRKQHKSAQSQESLVATEEPSIGTATPKSSKRTTNSNKKSGNASRKSCASSGLAAESVALLQHEPNPRIDNGRIQIAHDDGIVNRVLGPAEL